MKPKTRTVRTKRPTPAQQCKEEPPSDPAALRAAARELLRRACDADAAATFRVLEAGGVRQISTVELDGDRVLARLLAAFEGERPPLGSIAAVDATTLDARRRRWSLEAPLPGTVNRLSDPARGFAAPLDERDELETVSRWRRPGRIAQCLRALVYDEGRFVAWLGVVRCGVRPFTEAETARLERVFPRALQLVLEAERADRVPEQALLLFDASHDPIGETAEARAWLTTERRTRLLEALARAAPHALIDGAELRLLPLRSSERASTLVTLKPAASVRLGRAALPPRQRQIATHCVAGRSVPQIARALSISANTVKFHLKELYAALGVANRVELLRALEPP